MERAWVKMKRGLFYMPNDCGYTGIRDHAGRFTEAEAVAETSCDGVTAMPLDEAPEFSSACFDDLARAHLLKQRDALRTALLRLMNAVGRPESPGTDLDAYNEADEALNPLTAA